MVRKIGLALLALLVAGLGVVWYQGGSRPIAVEEQRSMPASPALQDDADSPALAIPATVPPPAPTPVSASNQSESSLSEPSVVGMSFELSESVRENCERSEGACKELVRFLVRMTAEPRNATWARDMEARIEKAVLSGERGKFRIRALECRSTRCALEVASEVDRIGIEFDSDPAFNDLMMPRQGFFANEHDPQTGITTLVSVQVWQTSEAFFAEDSTTR
jgi:hypothetical protein